MNALTKEWVQKAEADRRVSQRELRVKRGASHDIICFHAQQCAEKYLKAVLHESGVSFPKSHDLEALIGLILPKCPQFGAHLPGAKILTTHAVEVRYPGTWASRSDAQTAFRTSIAIRKLARAVLGFAPGRFRTKRRQASRKKSK